MAIRRVIFPFTGSQLGGSHISAFALGTALQRDFGIDVVVAAPSGSLIADTARQKSLQVLELGETPAVRHSPFHEARVLPRRVAAMLKLRQDAILHCHDLGALQSWALAAKLTRCPVVYHDRMFTRDTLPVRAVIGLADRVIGISRSLRERNRRDDGARYVQIDNPIDVEAPSDPAAHRRELFAGFGREDTGPLIGFSGNFWWRKRPHFFLDVCKQLASRMPSAHFVVFGRDGDHTVGELRQYAQDLGIAGRTMFAGFRLPAGRTIAILDLLAITAEGEPLGRTPIEAAMLGVPYLALDDAGIGEAWRRWGGGRLLELSASPDRFAEEALQILQRPGEVTLTKPAREALRAELSPHAHAAKVMEVYRQLRS